MTGPQSTRRTGANGFHETNPLMLDVNWSVVVGGAGAPWRWAWLVVLGVGLLAGRAGAQPNPVVEAFEAGNRAYAQGQYREAVASYRSVLDAGYASVALHHNLGNAYYRLDDVGRAIWQYERAQRLRPGDPRLAHNLDRVRERVSGPGAASPPADGWAQLVGGWPVAWLFGGGWLLLVGGLAVAVLRTRPDAPLPWTHPTVAGPVVAGLLVASLALTGAYAQTQHVRGVVLVDRVALRVAPDSTAAVDTTLHAGASVAVQRRNDGWADVRLAPNLRGWLPADALGTIDGSSRPR